MKKICLRALVGLIILALFAGFNGEFIYAQDHQNCSCCNVNKCHTNAKCHDTAKTCVCGYQPIQAFLQKDDLQTKFVFSGYLVLNLNFTYLYLSAKDIFHPPKSS